MGGSDMLTLCMSYFSCFVSGASCHFFSIPFWVVYFSLCTSQGEELSQDTAATPIKDQIAPRSGFPHSGFILTVFLHSGLLGTEATLEADFSSLRGHGMAFLQFPWVRSARLTLNRGGLNAGQ